MTQDVPNLRDLGGTPTADGGQVRAGVLLRSALPAATDQAPDGVVWPPAFVVDLRSSNEAEGGHPLAELDVQIRRISLLEALRPDGPQSANAAAAEAMRDGGLTALYVGMLQVATAEIVEVVTHVAESDGPTLVHCAAGKDRTGVIIALMLTAVGVPRPDVVADYLRTGDYMAAVLDRMVAQPGVVPGRRAPAAHLELPVEAIEAVLDFWDDHEGGAAGWLDKVSGDRGLAGRLRLRLVG